MKKPYETVPGTLPHRVMEYLKKREASGPENAVSTADLCEAMGMERRMLNKSLEPVRRHGLVRGSAIPGLGRTFWWWLGDGKPDMPLDYEDDKPFETLTPPHRGPALVGEMFPGVSGREPAADGFKAWLGTDGCLLMAGVEVMADGRAMLGSDATNQVRRLLAWSAPT